MSNDPKPPSDFMTHPPLPYVVVLREIPMGSDDAVPVLHQQHVMAYSVLEALLQANIVSGASGLDDSRFKVETIEPDLPAYALLLATHTAKVAMGAFMGKKK